MKLTEFTNYLEGKGRGSQGKNLFAMEIPADCTQGILLVGPPAGVPIDAELPAWRDTHFRLVVRSTDYLKGEQLAWDVSADLTIAQELQLGDLLIKRCQPLNEPRAYRRSVGAYWEFEVDIEVQYVDTSL